jgi:hypothetical protein
MYEHIFNNNKIKNGSKILIVSHTVIKSINIVKDLNISYMNILYDYKLPVIDSKFDIIIYIKLITSFETDVIYEIINNHKEYLIENGKVFFIDDLVLYENQIKYNPVSYLKNLLYNAIRYNLGKSVTISDAYDLFYQFNMSVIDCDRIHSEYYYNLYPVEYYSFICRFKN